MTKRTSQLLVTSDQAVQQWLLERFGIDTHKAYLSDRIEMEFKYREPVMLHVSFLVGADDLAAFPRLPHRPTAAEANPCEAIQVGSSVKHECTLVAGHKGDHHCFCGTRFG